MSITENDALRMNVMRKKEVRDGDCISMDMKNNNK
jgi:hypothetical protein